jgi:peptidyl-prolyl cis-trans isomerase D
LKPPSVSKSLSVKEVIPARTPEFESMKAEIRKDMEETKLADAQFELANSLDDALASGASPDEIKNQFDVEIKNIPAMSFMGMDAAGKSVIGDYKDIGDRLLQSLFELGEGEASAIFDMPDGRMAALVLKSITPKKYKPFEDVKETLLTQWTESTRKADNKLQVLKILGEMNTENQDMKDVAAKYTKQTQSLAGNHPHQGTAGTAQHRKPRLDL